jgi:hypothetical protein
MRAACFEGSPWKRQHAPRDIEGESAQQIPDALATNTADTPGRIDKSDAATTLTKGF